MRKPKPQPPATKRQFAHWIHPDLTIPVDDNSFLVDIPAHELQHLGTHNLQAYKELPMFPFPQITETATSHQK